jgi:hypothetical protein
VGDYDVLAAMACARGLGLLPLVTGHCGLSHGLPWRTRPELAARNHGSQSHAAGNGVFRRGAATITRQAWWAAGAAVQSRVAKAAVGWSSQGQDARGHDHDRRRIKIEKNLYLCVRSGSGG